MTHNVSGLWEGSLPNSSTVKPCGYNKTEWDQRMDKIYTYFYLLLFIPGLLLNTVALWILCRHISKKTKTVIFMINLAFADLAHILSLPLRIYYYFTHSWPFGQGACLFCFYLKYLNMYAAIIFLMCISIQRCFFLLDPFAARRWRRRYDLVISVTVWVVVGLACSSFIVMRSSSSVPVVTNTSSSLGGASTQQPIAFTNQTLKSDSSPNKTACFKDLPMRRPSLSSVVTMMVLGELFGFLIPLVCICYSSGRIAWSLKQRNIDRQYSSSLSSTVHSRLQSVSSNCPADNSHQNQSNSEKRRALRMVLACSALFLFCFAPYHLNFMFYLMVQQGIISNCAVNEVVLRFHPVSLCMASMSCCLNPLLYYFLTTEFRMHLTRRTSSFSTSLLSSPVSSPTQCPLQPRLMSLDSSCSQGQ
ncbi:putative P2Y purinoceptor 10 isoform 1-T2 [Pholidichthys leucotaenia]